MKRHIFFAYALILSIFFLESCTGSKSYSNKAAKLQSAGLTDEAANYYYIALQRNPKNVDALIGLKTVGQGIIDEKLNTFYKFHSMGEAKDAVYTYLDILAYQKKVAPFVKLEVPQYYEAYYEESKEAYLKQRYQEANDLLDDEEFIKADLVFKEIITIDPQYEDAESLKKLSTVEPIYRKGVDAYETGQYRTAYNYMADVLTQKPNYKDAIDYKDRAQEKALVTLAVTPFETSTSSANVIKDKIYADVLQGLLQSNDPFLKVIDRENIQAIVEEQKLSLSSAVDSKTAIDAGKLLGAKALLTGKVLSYSAEGGSVRASKQPAYEAYRVKKVNPRTNKPYYATEYRKTYYTEYTGSSQVTCNVEFRMVSTETGEILVSDVVKVKAQDAIDYAKYSGNISALYPGTYKSMAGPMLPSDKVFTSSAQKRALTSKFSSRQTLKSVDELRTQAASNAATQIAQLILQYNPDL